MTLKQRFGQRVKELRKRVDMSQEILAEKVGITARALSNIENGINGCGFDKLEPIAVALKVEVKELFNFEEK